MLPGPAETRRHLSLSPGAGGQKRGRRATSAATANFSGRFAPFTPFFPEGFFKGLGKEPQTQKWKTGKSISSDLYVIVSFRAEGTL